MRTLLPTVIAGMLLACLYNSNSNRSVDANGRIRYGRRASYLWVLAVVIMAILPGLRLSGNDTSTYKRAYEMYAISKISFSNLGTSLATNPGYVLVIWICRLLGLSFQSYLMLYSFVTVSIYLWFIRKYSESASLAFYLFVTMGVYTFCFAAIKQTAAVAFCLLGVDAYFRRKYIRYVFWVVMGMLFHEFAFVFFLVPLLDFRPWSNKTFLLLVITLAIGLFMNQFMSSILSLVALIGETYTEETLTGEGVNLFRVAVVWMPVLVSYLNKNWYSQHDNTVDNIVLNLSMINAMIMFIGLFGTANFFARLANYFLIFQAIALPSILKPIKGTAKQVILLASIVGYLLYFYYASGVQFGGFDQVFTFTTLRQYLSTLFGLNGAF